MIEKLPSCLLYTDVQPYLSLLDYRYFLNASKSLFQGIKYETLLWSFKIPFNLKFVTEPEFQRTVLKRMRSASQLLISCSSLTEPSFFSFLSAHQLRKLTLEFFGVSEDSFNISFSSIVTLGIPNLKISYIEWIKDLPEINTLFTVKLAFWKILFSFSSYYSSPACNLQVLELHKCPCLTILPHFPSLLIIRISECHLIRSVETLKDIPSVSLRSCFGIKDVKCFQKNHKIEILNCKAIKRFSTESFKYSTFISLSGSKLEFVFSFQAVKELKLTSVSIKKITVLPKHLISLSITDCHQLEDISGVFLTSELRFVHVESCPVIGLSPVSYYFVMRTLYAVSLYNMKMGNLLIFHRNEPQIRNCHFKIGYCHNISDFSQLNHVSKVSIIGCTKFSNNSQLKNVGSLTIDRCPNFRFVASESYPEFSIQELSLNGCEIDSLYGCRNIPVITIDSCLKLHSIQDLGNNDKIILIGMVNEIDDLEMLAENYISSIRDNKVVYLRKR
jgi:hypothetical protein